MPSTDKDGKPSLSIGDLNTMEDAVYYWNLVNSFIPNYYDEFLPSEEGEKRDNAIKKIAEDIYLLYKDLGPGEACPISTPYICRSDDGSEYFNAYTYDPSGKFTTQSGIQFFDNISAVAINEMTKAGINASITMAQAALESGWGGSTLSKQFSNYYGITAGGCTSGLGSPSEHKNEVYQSGEAGNTCTGNAYWNGSVVAMCNSAGNDCQWYRIYDSFENSTRDHTALTTGSSIYAGCNSSSDSLDQITCIKERGYATDPKYVQKVMDLINTYNLTQYDIGNWNGQPLTMPTTPNYTNHMCYSLGGGASGDWASWKQCDSQWGGLNIGSKTICRVGCLLTSVAIQIARSGVPTTLGDSFNPGTFMQAHKANGGFSGNSFYWNVTDVAPNFQLVNHNIAVNNSNAASVVDSYIKQGYYVILNLHHPTEHHVAVNYVDGNKIYMYDPGNFGDEVFSAFRGNLTIDSIAIYKAG